jgi:hypothetical protein
MDGSARFSLAVEFRGNLKRLYGCIPEEPRYRLRVGPASRDSSSIMQAQLLEKLDDMQEIRHRGTRQFHETMIRYFEAEKDKWFQARLQSLLAGTQPRKGGRPRAVRTP